MNDDTTELLRNIEAASDELRLIGGYQPALFETEHRIDADQASAQSSTVATRADSAQWSTVLVNRAADDLEQIEDYAQARRVELDRWFTARVADAFQTFHGDVLAGVLHQLTVAAEEGLSAIETEAVEKIARRAVLS